MNIIIPTLGRADKQITLRYLTDKMKKEIFLACEESEAPELMKLGTKLLVCPKRGIANVRQFAIDVFGDSKILFMDDDQHFYVRKSPESWHLRYANPEEVTQLIYRIERKLDEYAMVGVSARQGNQNFFPATEVISTRMCNMYGLRTDILNKHEIEMNKVRGKEDFYTQLSLLTRGYPTLLLCDVAWGQPTSNAAGGCSFYRNLETDKEDSEILHNLFPSFVKVVTKTSKWPNMPNRTDVTIYWQQALNYGIRRFGRQECPSLL